MHNNTTRHVGLNILQENKEENNLKGAGHHIFAQRQE